MAARSGPPKGLDKLIRQFKALPESQLVASRKNLRDGAGSMAKSVAAAAPRRDGALPKGRVHLADTVRVEEATGRSNAKSRAGQELAEVRKVAGLSVKIVAGGPGAPHALWTEYGTKGSPKGSSKDSGGKTRTNKRAHAATPAQPFFFPTIRAQLKPLKAKMARANRQAAIAAVNALK